VKQRLARWAGVMFGAVLALAAPTAAFAEPPVDLGGAYILDTVGAVTGQEDAITDSLKQLAAETDVQLFVVYVDSFDGVPAGQSWADATAELNGLGNDDVLMAVAVGDRNYQLSYPNGFELSEGDTRRIESELIEPRLSDNDWAGAAVAAADGLRQKVTDPGFPWGWTLLGLIVVVGLVLFIRSRMRRGRAIEAQKLSQKELDQRASILLVQLDDEIKTSEQELGFAVAQFGEEAAKPFVSAVAAAKEKARAAFELRQKLDDAFPESAEERRAMTLQIVELAEAGDAELDAQADAFDELRALEKTAPENLTTVRAGADEAGARLQNAERTLETLEQEYSAAAVAPVAGNPKQAEELLAFAANSATEAEQALTAGQTGRAAVAVRAAQAAVGQVTQLLDAIDRVATDLSQARATLAAVVSDTEQDLAAGRALPDDPQLASAIAAAEAALSAAASGDNPITSLTNLQKANEQLDAVLASVREEQENVRRAAAALDQAIFSARAEISAAHDFITTRRGGIGDTARTRLSEATRHLDAAAAVAPTDPVTALSHARAASNLAQNALASAQNDVEAYSLPGYGGMGGYGNRRRSVGSDVGGAILGGIIGGMLSGGGGGIFGGGGFGGGFGGGGRSGGFGGRSRGVSGGRRSSGGRF
jgi:hypothetical protein